jgi:hypothetical protein
VVASEAARSVRLASSAMWAAVLGVLALVLLAVAVVLSGLVHQLSVLGTGPVIPGCCDLRRGRGRGRAAPAT